MLPPPSAKSSNCRVAGMIAPDPLLELVAADPGRDGAPLRAVEPAVGPPGHRVDGRVRVLEPEPGEQHLGVAVGPIVVVSIGIEQQVRAWPTKTPPCPTASAEARFKPSTKTLT